MSIETEALVVAAPGPAPVFAGAPSEVLAAAGAVADALRGVIERQRLYVEISRRRHVRVEGWTTLAALCGLSPVVVWCRRIEREGEIVYSARVEVRRAGGDVVGAAEAMCSDRESRWQGRDEYAIASMAQTRATAKSVRVCLSWVLVLAGYDPTPAEEMAPEEEPRPAHRPVEAARQTLDEIIDEVAARTGRDPSPSPGQLAARLSQELLRCGDAPALCAWYVGAKPDLGRLPHDVKTTVADLLAGKAKMLGISDLRALDRLART